MQTENNTKSQRHRGTIQGVEKGSTITLLAVTLVAIFFILGISIDLGSAYVLRSRLSKAVDAGVLAGARSMPQGDAAAETSALKVARANYTGEFPAEFQVEITRPTLDTKRIAMVGTTNTPTRFAVMMGETSLNIATGAEATRYPLDLSLALDRSGSMKRNDVFDDMQFASIKFLEYFDESSDQLGVTSYSTIGWEDLPVQKFFKIPGKSAINAMDARSDTNIQEGLRQSKVQLDAAPSRPGALRVVVLFTDGRPTAFRDTNPFPSLLCPDYDGVVAAYISGGSYRGLFRPGDGDKVTSFTGLGCVLATAPNLSGILSPKPSSIFTGPAVSGPTIRNAATTKSEQQADEIRAAGYTIYAIGLGNPNSDDPGDNPDLDLLRRITNQGGITNSDEPRGETYFAPSAAELDEVFAQLADRLLTRLTR